MALMPSTSARTLKSTHLSKLQACALLCFGVPPFLFLGNTSGWTVLVKEKISNTTCPRLHCIDYVSTTTDGGITRDWWLGNTTMHLDVLMFFFNWKPNPKWSETHVANQQLEAWNSSYFVLFFLDFGKLKLGRTCSASSTSVAVNL